MKIRHRGQRRSGSVLVFAAVMMVVMFGMLAFAIDVGYLQLTRSQLQNAADATALAAAWDLIDEDALSGYPDPSLLEEHVRVTADDYASYNPVAGAASQLAYEDVEIGYLADPSSPDSQLSPNNPSFFNAVRVQVRRTDEQNGGIALFFARVLGIDSVNQRAQATAMFLNNISGFRAPPPGEYLGILPFAFYEEDWDDLIDNGGSDEWTSNRVWNEDTQEWESQVAEGSDGAPELNLFPQDTGSPGNFGTINIGGNNNSTAVLRRQIELGLNADDFSDYPDQQLVINPAPADGLTFTGNTGISAGMASALRTIVGEPRIVPLYETVVGNGSNATYTIVKFVGVRVVEVDFKGSVNSGKRLVLQPANVIIPHTVQASVGDPMNPTDEDQVSEFVFSPVWLVR